MDNKIRRRKMKRLISLFISLMIILQSIPVIAQSYKSRVQDKVIASEEKFWGIKIDEGRNLLYAADGTKGIKIIDVENPVNIQQIGCIKTNALVRTVAYYKNYVYTIPVDSSTVRIYDTSDPKNPMLSGQLTVSGAGSLLVSGRDLYVIASDSIKRYSLENPIAPIEKASISGLGNIMGVSADDMYLYTINTGTLLTILNKEDMRKISQITVAGANYPNLYKYMNYLYILQNTNPGKIIVVNIRDIEKPEVVHEYAERFPAVAAYNDGLLLVGCSQSGSYVKYKIGDDGSLTKVFSVDYNGSCGVGYINGYEILGKSDGVYVFKPNFMITKDMFPKVPKTNRETVLKECFFEDIEEYRYKEAIEYLFDKGVLSGIDKTHFAPNETSTRAQLFTTITKLMGYNLSRYKNGYVDVSEKDWYADYVQTIADNGLISSEFIKDKKILPNEKLDVKMLCDMLYKIYNGNIRTKLVNTEPTEAARELGIITEEQASDTATRGVLANALHTTYKLINSQAVFAEDGKYYVGDNQKVTFTKLINNEPQKAVAGAEWDIPPVIYRVTDAVKPDQLFNLYGEGFVGDLKVYMSKITSSDIPDTLPETAFEGVIYKIDEEGQFITTRLPEDKEAASYFVWVENKFGYSKPVVLNGVRVDWIDQKEAAYNMPVRILGTNLCAKEFDAKMSTGVALIGDDDKVYDVNIVGINPYCIDITVPNTVPTGTYTVVVSNDGYIWDVAEDRQEIEVIGAVDDPLGLNMPWANRFVWDNVIDVTKAPYNVVPDGQTNSTQLIQQAIDDAKAAGGGRVYLPQGIYKISSIYLPSKVVIEGAGAEKTVVLYECVEGSSNMITTKDDGKTEGIVGCANMTLKTTGKNSVPDAFIWFAEDWGSNIDNRSLRCAKYVFVTGCKLEDAWDFDAYSIGGRRGMGMVLLADSHLLVDDNVFYGGYCPPCNSYPGEYTYFTNNKMIQATGQMYAGTTRGIFMNNSIEFRQDLKTSTYSQGIFLKGYCYASHNEFRNLGEGERNCGEIICAESFRGGTKLLGTITQANETQFTFENLKQSDGTVIVGESFNEEVSWSPEITAFGESHAVITKGRGLGQVRRVVASDKETNTITIDEPWDIVPDETSQFAVIVLIEGLTMYNNWCDTALKGYWLYQDSYDCVVAGNTGIDTEGVYARSYNGNTTKGKGSSHIEYFARIDDNKSTGFSKYGGKNGIYVTAAQIGMSDGTCDVINYTAYGIDIRDNTIIGGDEIPSKRSLAESPMANGIYITGSNFPDGRKHFKAGIIEGNTVSKMEQGLSLGDTDDVSSIVGVVIKDNDFSQNEVPMKGGLNLATFVED